MCKVGVNTIPFPTSLTSRGHDEEAPSHLFYVNFAARAISPAESQYSASNMSSTFRHQIASVTAIGRLELVVSWEGSLGRHLVLWNSGRLPTLSCYSQGSCCHPWVVKRKDHNILLRCQTAPGCLARGTRTARHLGLSLRGLAGGLIGAMVVRIFCFYLCHLWAGIGEGCDFRVGISSCGKVL